MEVSKKDFKTLISTKELDKRIKEIGKQITGDYNDKEIILVCVLKGSMYFTVDLSKYIDLVTTIDCIRVSSYSGRNTTGSVKLKLDVDEDLTGKDIIIIEDIIDTGTTLKYLLEYFKQKNPNSIKLCTLLDKPSRRKFDIKVDYIGFEIPDKFVLGYGLDYDEKYRNLPYIAYIEE